MGAPEGLRGPRWNEAGVTAAVKRIDDWLHVEPDGTVTVLCGKVELGTGVRTALAQIVAEELDVPFEHVQMVMGDTARTPDEGYTAGSKTIQSSGANLRQASAEARQVLLEMASDQLDAAVDELDVHDGVVTVRHHPTRTITYAQLVGGKPFNREMTGKARLKSPDAYRIVGKPVPRVEIPGKFTGAPSFVHDIRLPGMLHGRVVRPPSPGAELVSLDADSVRDARVVHLGAFLGVVGEREEQAVRAARDLKVEWRETKRFPRMEDLYDELRRQPTVDRMVLEQGDSESALERAAVRREAFYCQPYQAHASIGPSCAVADYQDDGVTIWCSTQGVYPLARTLADLLQLPVERVHLIFAEGAGCYGQNGSDDVAADAAILSRAAGKPVRVQWSRADEFGWEPYAPAMVIRMRGGVDAHGRIVGWEYEAWSPTHAARPRSGAEILAGQLISGKPPPPRAFFLGGDRNAPTDYTLPNQRVLMHWLADSPLRASSFRALGATANTLANESFMDELALAARVDPVQFRLSHLEDPRARAVLQTAAQSAHWGDPLPEGEGRGVAFVHYENQNAYVATVAHVAVDRKSGDARVKHITVAHDCGLVINPDGLKNQIEGNVIQSLSRALKEEVRFDESHITSVDWDTYPILKFEDVPEVEVVLINRPDQPAVGAGEPSTTTTGPAVANAIDAATGARVRQVPFSPARVRAALI